MIGGCEAKDLTREMVRVVAETYVYDTFFSVVMVSEQTYSDELYDRVWFGSMPCSSGLPFALIF